MAETTHGAHPSYVRTHLQKMRTWVPSVSDEPALSDPIRLGTNENNFGCCIGGVPVETPLNHQSLVVSKDGSLGDGTLPLKSIYGSAPTNTNVSSEGQLHGARDDSLPFSPSEFSIARFAQDILWLQRYSGSNQVSLKRDFARWRGLPNEDYVCLGMGALDLADSIMRATCEPKIDSMLITPPTFFAYNDRALINDIPVVEVPLEFRNNDFILSVEKIKDVLTNNSSVRLIMLASPGNPSGSLIPVNDVRELLEFVSPDIVIVVDEAYIDYATSLSTSTVLPLITQHPNLIVLNTLSKAQGLAGLRLGAAYAQPPLITQLTKIQLPHLIPSPVAFLGHLALSPESQATTQTLITRTISARQSLIKSLSSPLFQDLGLGDILGGNQGNFVVVRVLARGRAHGEIEGEGEEGVDANARARMIVSQLRSDHGIEIKFLGTLAGVDGCLRVTAGTEGQLRLLIEGLEVVMRRC